MLALQNSWQPMAIMCAGSFFIALFYIFILKWITKPLLYMSLLIILIALCAFGAFVFMYQYTPNLSISHFFSTEIIVSAKNEFLMNLQYQHPSQEQILKKAFTSYN
jgi:hypothetical protein